MQETAVGSAPDPRANADLAPGPPLPGPPGSPAWRWSYVVFRFGDGATQALLPLAIVLHYGLPLWVLALMTACMNLVAVPATFLWGAVVDRSRHRRAIVVLGFAVSAIAMAMVATLPPVPLYIGAAMLYTMFGVATSPAASTLALQGVERASWARATTSLSRRTGLAYLVGMVSSVALGFALPTPPFAPLFLLGAGTALAGAIVASRTIPHLDPPKLARPFDPEVAVAGQRNFERSVFFPGRLLHRPTLRGIREGLHGRHRLWPLGVTLTFTGSVAFFTSYPGVLANHLLLPAGLVLLCQAPSHIVTPFAYPWAGRHGARIGEPRAVRRGALLRLIGVPGLIGGILILGAKGVPFLLAFHALMGLSFSLMQVNGPLMLAALHPGGKGPGVGLYHSSVGGGTLAGSVAAFILLRAFDAFWVSYVFALTLTLVGVSCLLMAYRRLMSEGFAGAHVALHAPPQAP